MLQATDTHTHTLVVVVVVQRKLFAIGQQELGDGQVLCQWSSKGSWLAAAGNKASAEPQAAIRNCLR